MKRLLLILTALIFVSSFAFNAFATPGDYTLRVKAGPAFALQDHETQVKFGGEFDYDLGFGWGVGLEALLGIKNDFLFVLSPHVRFTYLFVGPAELFLKAGGGYMAFDKDSAFGLKFGTGIVLPLKGGLELMSDVTFTFVPLGTPNTPIILDWLIGLGFRFGGGQ